MGVIRKAKGYKIRVDPPGIAEKIILTTCHRQMATPPPKQKGGWFSDKYYEFEFYPDEQHEIEKACSFDIGVYESGVKERHAWGLLIIESDRAGLAARVKCNGTAETYGGTSKCQAKAGLIQSIHFDRPVKLAAGPNCEIKIPKDNMNFVYRIPADECKMFFVDINNAEKFHKAVLFGYEQMQIRGVE
jgi:hypothetical protein